MIKFSYLTLGVLVCCASLGCAKGPKPYEPNSKAQRTIFMPSYRQAGGEPVYARTRWVHPPEVLPRRESETRGSSYDRAPALRPVYHLSVKNATLEQTCKLVASMARYSSYVSPSLLTQTFSFENLGTIDELARIIEEKATIKVLVDHENKEVRFLVRTALEPTLYSE